MAEQTSTASLTRPGDLKTIASHLATPKDSKRFVQDCFRASENATSKRREQWRETYRLYHGYLKTAGQPTRQANYHFHKIFQQVELEVARYIVAFFSRDPFNQVLPTNGASVDAARAMEEVMQYYYEHSPTHFFARLRQVKYAILYGCGYIMPTWRSEKRKVKKLVPFSVYGREIPGISMPVETEEIVYEGLHFEAFSPADVFPYPGTGNPFNLPWCGLREFVQAEELVAGIKNAEDHAGYDLSAIMRVPLNNHGQVDRTYKQRLQDMGMPDAGLANDPGLICLEHLFTGDRVLTLANNEVIIREAPNPFEHLEIPLLMGVKTIDPEGYYPIGTGKVLTTTQKLYSLYLNTSVNSTLTSVWPIWKYRSNVNPNQLVSFPNNRIPVNSMDDVDVVKMPELKNDLLAMKAVLDAQAEEITGYYGTQKGFSAQQATATRDQIFAQQGDQRISSDVMTFEAMALLPEARQVSKIIQQMMPEGMEHRINGPGGPTFMRRSPNDVRGEYDFRPSGLSERVNRDVIQQQMLNYYELTQSATQLIRLPDGEIVPMPVINTYETLKSIVSGFDPKSIDKLLYRPELFGRPVTNAALGINAAPSMPGMDALSTDPRTGGLSRPAKKQQAKPTDMASLRQSMAPNRMTPTARV